ncbi:helix-turn-helix domain-containing protein [Coleofasciculus sp. LEGE 07092]|nr:helix-turn-helix domain-containing protein [Coleofasciculus sp. LEGE 07081]MBE9149444.1 helix-turn-helix domain-containing protein [Coleofasciculus sp. LEGE 07092]
MVMQPIYGHGFGDNPAIEMSQEGLRSILNQIETELLESEVYRRTMAGLQTMLGEASNTAQILVKAVGREAVRLTFQQFAKQYKIVPVTAEDVNQAQEEELDLSEKTDNPLEEVEVQVNLTETLTDAVAATQPSGLFNRAIGETKPRKKPTKAELAAQKLAQEREELLLQVGQELRRARQDRALSVEQLHRQTLVPIHQIESLEAGRIDHLPEDVYVRGFIRRLSEALGLNGSAMAASVPTPDPVRSVIPSWYHDPSDVGFQFNSMHLYLGYAALIAGAVGGLNWMSHQSTQETALPEPTTPSNTSVSPKDESTKPTSKPGIKSSQGGVKAGADIAPPEALLF